MLENANVLARYAMICQQVALTTTTLFYSYDGPGPIRETYFKTTGASFKPSPI